MNDRDLNRLLRQTPEPLRHGAGSTDFAETILSRLPRVRWVIPGSLPGPRILIVAAVLGLGTAAGISLYRHRSTEPGRQQPPPSTLFQPGAAEPRPASAPR